MCECKKEKPQSLQGAFMRLLHRYTEVNFGRLKDLGVHPGQLPFLNIIRHQEGISQRELAERLHVKPPTVAVTVKRLEKAGVIFRKPDPEDMRISRIYLTGKGREIAGRIEGIVQENERALTAGFSEEEVELAKAFFDRMLQNLDVLAGGTKIPCMEGAEKNPVDDGTKSGDGIPSAGKKETGGET